VNTGKEKEKMKNSFDEFNPTPKAKNKIAVIFWISYSIFLVLALSYCIFWW
jgi:hypothetical protein